MPDDIYGLMRGTPSTRAFTDEPVDRAALRRVFDNARFAPSGGNRQGWRVVVVSDRETRRRLRELYAAPWDAYLEQTGGRAALEAGPDSGLSRGRLRGLQAADAFARHFDEVPVHLVVLVELGTLAITDAPLHRPSIVGGASIYPFVHNLLLGLRHEGLGAAFTTLLVPAEAEVRTLLQIPDEYALAGHISVGHRAGPWPTKLNRRPATAFVFGERFGAPW